MPRYTPLISTLPSTVPFVGPETQERARGGEFRARLGANEGLFGLSPKAVEAMSEAARQSWKYGDPENHDLKHAIAEFHGVSPANIVIGEGIDGLLGLLVRMLISNDTPVVTSLGAYPTFNFHVAGFGGKIVPVPYVDDCEDPASLLAAVNQHDAPLVYFTNPDNPMGTHHDANTVQKFIDAVPDETVFCLDEAYCEFAPEGTVPAIDVSRPNVVRMRTFSKAYGMAGIRVGYAVAHEELVRSFNKVRNHYGMNIMGLAGAQAALADQIWLKETLDKVRASNERIAEIAKANGLQPLPTATNFVTMDCGATDTLAKAIVAELSKRDVFIRMPFVAPQNRCIRISAGRREDLDILEAELPAAIEAAHAEVN